MIGFITGEVKAVIRDTVTILTASGVGYRVHTLSQYLAKASEGMPADLFTYLAVREHAHDLYGFETKEELRWFELLLTVSSIGPKSALSVLNSVSPADLAEAIQKNDPLRLSQAVGVGKKTAEKIVLELKEKVDIQGGGGNSARHDDITEALVSLGYSLKEAQRAVQGLPQESEGETTEERLRKAIQIASGN